MSLIGKAATQHISRSRGFQRNPQDLRWTKSDIGQPVTWCYNHANNPLPFLESQLNFECHKAIGKISDIVFNLDFQENSGAPCDIEIMWDTAGDGPGSTLAFVFQPIGSNNMAACGICGDVFMDDAEAFSLTDFFNVLLHELGHSVGLQHTDDLSPPVSFGNNVMDPFYTFGSAEFEWGPSDIEQLQIRYPNNF